MENNSVIYNQDEIKLLKYSLLGLHISGENLKQFIIRILNMYEELSMTPQLSSQMNKAAETYILAYIQLGFSYMEHATMFDRILIRCGYSKKQLLVFHKYNPIITITPNSIRGIIGKWSASPYNSHKIGEAILEIIEHVKNKDPGVFDYYTAKPDGEYISYYKLYISDADALFYNVFDNKFYSLQNK